MVVQLALPKKISPAPVAAAARAPVAGPSTVKPAQPQSGAAYPRISATGDRDLDSIAGDALADVIKNMDDPATASGPSPGPVAASVHGAAGGITPTLQVCCPSLCDLRACIETDNRTL